VAVAPSTRDQEFYAIIAKKKKTNISLSHEEQGAPCHVGNEVGFDLRHHLLLRLVDYSLRKVQ